MIGDGAIRGMLAICTAILAAGALYLARSVLAPVAFSFFAMAVVWPLQRTLQAKMPKIVALAGTLVLTLIVLVLLALAVPMTAALLTICEQHAASKWLPSLLTDSEAPSAVP